MSSMSGYRSPVDLGLGRVPQTGDPELFAELTDVYNSLHLLSAYMDKLRLSAGGGSGQFPNETMPFNRFYVSIAMQDIPLGSVVSPSQISGQDGSLLGAAPNLLSSGTPDSIFAGVALTAGVTGSSFRVGVGPGAIEVPGAVGGGLIWAYCQRATNGNPSFAGGLYPSQPPAITAPAGGTVYPMPVGIGIANNYGLIGKYFRR